MSGTTPTIGRGASRPSARRAARAAARLAALVGLLVAAGCVHRMAEVRTAPGAPPGPAVPWTPRPGSVPAPPPAAPAAAIPSDLLKTAQDWALNDLIDLALRNSPGTRVTWSAARSAAAALGAQRGAYYPAVFGQEVTNRTKGSAVGGQFTFLTTNTEPSVVLNYLLLDFGGRKAAVEEARQALVAADWSHNAAIQDSVLRVEQAYYQYLNARILERAEAAAVKEAQASLDAATLRHDSGLSTVIDILQARTALSQAQLSHETVQGQIQTIHGVLATALGLPADTAFEVEIPEQEIPLQQGTEEIERLIAAAQVRRPDLAAARSLVLKTEAHVRQVKSLDRPLLSTSLNAGRIYYAPDYNYQDVYGAALTLTVPIFNGLTYQYNVFKAEADAETERARLDSLQQQVIFQVWSGYYNQRTATQRVATSRDLLESARQSYEAISARYRAGVGSILDLLTAEAALESARAQEAGARTDWFLAVAQLAHDTGTLWGLGTGNVKDTP
ncbi:MAG TPA: TolC family protein [Candidatus Dormibacteraeota bacterium]|nr:TolC family protein [Candidatus Dormibacteraeota bacterium]